ncbi:MAG: twin-arginine translocase subunit TatC [Deltaproteobacteria bacterium]|nr:twin-arginine translocase subunit TatC [Deltaproteobacteria bacterium]
MDKTEKRPLTEHLDELRVRLIRCVIAVLIGFIGAYAFKEKLFAILMKPLLAVMNNNGTMIFTGLPEAFFTYLKTSFLAGLILASPVIIYQFWMFIAPGLYKKERLILLPAVILSVFFFAGGALFGYFIVFPFGFRFFLGFATDSIQALPSMREYLAFSSKLLLVFGFVFELPIVITFMARLGLVSVDFLKKNRKYAILIFFIVAAILTPPDVITQAMLAMPLILLYEVSIIGARIFGREKKQADEATDE